MSTILLKNAEVYTPKKLGKKDILIKNGYIEQIKENINSDNVEVIDCSGKFVIPAFVDGHEHILYDRMYKPNEIKNAGVGTLVGVLAYEQGDNYIRWMKQSAENLINDNINAKILTGGFRFPQNTLSGDIYNDIVNYPTIVGTKYAFSYSFKGEFYYNNYKDFKNMCIKTFSAGKVANKNVQVHIHLEKERNNDSNHLDWIDKVHSEEGIPYSLFKITHARKIGNKAIELCNKGIWVDYTALEIGDSGDKLDVLCDAIKDNTIENAKISISSDSFGILNRKDGKAILGSPENLLYTLKMMVINKNLELEKVLPLFTTNPAKLIDESKSIEINVGNSCKMLILNNDFSIFKLINFD